ncbi:hypothetical protein BRN96_17740, partial [Xanthomonas oryzae pv. oryzae]
MPNAVAMQTWVTQLHAQLRQRGWPTQIELTQDSNLVWRSACTFSYFHCVTNNRIFVPLLEDL